MFIDRETREKLNTLSKKAFGAPSYWCDLVKKGATVPVMSPDGKVFLHNKVEWFITQEDLLKFVEERCAKIDAANKVSDETPKS